MEQRESLPIDFFVIGSKIRSMLLSYLAYGSGALIAVLCIDRFDLLIWILVGAAIGICIASWQSPDKIFSLTEKKVIGPASFGRKLVEIPVSQLDINRLHERSVLDKLLRSSKIPSTTGKNICISAMDFNSKQRDSIFRALEKFSQTNR